LHALLGDDASLQPLTQLLITRTQGNPFFLEESVRTWLTDKTQTLSFAGCFLVLKHKTRLATSSILLLRGHRWFRIRCAA